MGEVVIIFSLASGDSLILIDVVVLIGVEEDDATL